MCRRAHWVLVRNLVFEWLESVRLMALRQSNARKGYGRTAEDNPNSKSNSKVQKTTRI